jgi:effector-binding domain-containing protein
VGIASVKMWRCRMSKEVLYSIGQMAKICNVSVQTLRHYDNIDLLKPDVVKDNGYRYYSDEQILSINIIKALKELNLSLTKVKNIINKNDINYVLELFKKNNLDLEEQIKSLSIAKNSVLNLIENIELHNSFDKKNYIEVKSLPARTVAYTRYNSPSNPKSYMKRFNELHKIVEKNKLITKGSIIAIFHDHYTEFDYEDADIEVCVRIEKPEKNNKYIRTISEGKYLSKYHKGSYETMTESYQDMLDWCEENKYKMVGSAIEIYLVDFLTTKDPEQFITELQIPVKKTS